MLPGLTHRLRRHRLVYEDQHWSVGGYIERGGTHRLLICSCGRTWMRVCVNPLRDEWKWL